MQPPIPHKAFALSQKVDECKPLDADRRRRRGATDKPGAHQGGAVQADPIKPTAKAPGANHLKL